MHRHHLTYLDRALARLLAERARLTRGVDARLSEPSIEDLLRRSDGDVDADELRAVFRAVHQACTAGRSAAEVAPTCAAHTGATP